MLSFIMLSVAVLYVDILSFAECLIFIGTLSVIVLNFTMLSFVMLSVAFYGIMSVIVLIGIMLSVAFYWYTECHGTDYHFAEFRI
jgi:hypothetical protein